MSKKKKAPMNQEQESILDFEVAKEMTIGQAVRKSEELEAGVHEDDNVLDKYIKQHRQEIESVKFAATTQLTEENIEIEEKEDLEEVLDTEMSIIDETDVPDSEIQDLDAEVSQAFSDEVVSDSRLEDELTEVAEENASESEEKPKSNKKVLIGLVSAFAVTGIAATAYFTINRNQASRTASDSSSQTSQKTSSNSSSSENKALKAFNSLYDSFFTDKNKLAIKNSSFANLEQLKTKLESLKNSKEYTVAKAKYENLVKQVSAIQAVNAQFETPVIKDGVLDTNAKVKSGATFAVTKTGNDNLDKLLSSAISQGKGQQTLASQGSQGASSADSPSSASQEAPVASADQSANTNAGIGQTSTGVALQRNLSRVPYNQALINDTANAAWSFNPGILENILQVSRERGYITGNQYIIEKVNIINGNGYYNLFKPDGTYLFSINCKTGYFVGNGSGYADALDY